MTNKDNLTHKDFFFCYTKKLSEFLRQNGVSYLLKANSVKDNNTFTMYVKSERLQELLDKYKQLSR